MKKVLFFLMATAFLAVSCKNKNVAKSLEGTWNEVEVDGNAVSPSAQDQLIFGKCNGGKKADCDLTLKDAGGTTISNWGYTVTDKGEILRIEVCQGIVCAGTNNNISDKTETSMTIDWGNYVGKYEKQ